MVLAAFFGVVILSVWAHFDSRDGQIGNYTLSIPIGIAFILNWWAWVSIYLPMFLGFIFLYILANKKTPFKFGFADVMALPFGVWITIITGYVMMIVFPLMLGLQILIYDRLPRFLVPARQKDGNIRFLPVIFNALAVALIAHVVFLLLG